MRFWHSWYRHITLSMMAHAWLASIKQQEQGKKAAGTDELAGLTVPEVRRLLAIALPLPVRSPELRLALVDFSQAGSGCGPVAAITDDVRSADALVHALMRLHNYGCSTSTFLGSFALFSLNTMRQIVSVCVLQNHFISKRAGELQWILRSHTIPMPNMAHEYRVEPVC